MPQPLAARTGRDLQKYDDCSGHRLVAGCIPIRHVQRNGAKHVEILLISSSKSSNLLVLPKGGWEVDETLEAAAARETMEEAGVVGDLEGPKRGPYTFSSRNSGPCKAYMYIMKVKEELSEWPEKQKRKRSWYSIDEAVRLCKWDWMKVALCSFKGEMSMI